MKESSKKHIQYSVIIPIPQLEEYIQTYRFQYDFFAKRGIPTHMTLLFLFDKDIYLKNREKFHKVLGLALKSFAKKKMVVDHFYQTPNMFSLGLNKECEMYFQKKQEQIMKYLDIDMKADAPHITLFTQRGSKAGFQKIPQIKEELTKHLPVQFMVDRIWLLEINTRENIATLVHEFK